MSELAEIMERFLVAKRLEYEKAGQSPTVCIAGWLSCEVLRAALLEKFSGLPLIEDHGATMEWEGVKIYISRGLEEGFYFGHRELP